MSTDAVKAEVDEACADINSGKEPPGTEHLQTLLAALTIEDAHALEGLSASVGAVAAREKGN